MTIKKAFPLFILAVLGMVLPLTALSSVEAPKEVPKPVCGFEEKAGRIIVDFTTSSKKIHDDKDGKPEGLERATMQVSATIPAGTYGITLSSYDGYKTRAASTESAWQLNERWFVVLNGEGNEIARTSAISDIEDGVMYVGLTEQVESNFVISTDVDSVVATHAMYGDGIKTLNSVKPVCAAFDKIKETEPITITASKIICENEEDLPNWGEGGSNITISTATDWVSQNNSCSLASGWSFQWGEYGLVSNPGDDFYGEADGGWATFGPTGDDGITTVQIDGIEEVSKIWVREVLQDGYIPFTFMNDNNNNDISAEFYCSDDVLNYDNYDYVRNIEDGNEYYCVAFNSPVEVENTKPVITLLGDSTITLTEGDTFTDPGATADDVEDGNGLPVTDITGTVDTNTAGSYTITYNFTDLGGLVADSVTRTVEVEELPKECTDTVMARVIISDIENWNSEDNQGNMTVDIYLGSTTTTVASGEWFPLYESGSFINDPDMTSDNYEDVPGLAVQRVKGTGGDKNSVRVVIYGSHPKTEQGQIQTKEHVSGTIEFSGTEFFGFRSDDSGNNRLEKGFDDSMTYSAGDDEVWSEDGINNFWLTVTTADDGFFADYGESYLCPFTPNTKPVITLLGTESMFITVGGTFNDPFVTANDDEDGDVTSEVIVGGMTVDTSTVGAYVVRYNVSDSKGLAADEVMRLVIVEEGEVENTKPVITLLGDSTITLTEDNTFTDPGATADDAEDGDITEDIIVGGDSVDTNTAGTYTITYNVTDEDGLSADEVTRTVVVKEKEIITPTCTNCGGGGNGGGGPIMSSLRIFNEKLELLSSGAVLFSWETDKEATSRVVYDITSQKRTTYAINVGYASSTQEVLALSKKHTIMISGLLPDTQYFFRPISVKGSLTKIGNEKTFALSVIETVETDEIIGECSYLKDYLRMGDDNDVEEVKKLQQFLKDFEGFSDLNVTGVFDQITFDAVAAFQDKYGSEVLIPWGIEGPTGYVYYTTQKKINEIHCKRTFPLSQNQQAEIVSFNALLNELQETGRESEIDFNTIGRANIPQEEVGVENIELALLADSKPVEIQDGQNGQIASILGGIERDSSGGTTTESVLKKGMFASVFGAVKNGFGAVVGSFKKFFKGNSTNEDEIEEDLLDGENIEEDSIDTEEE